MPYQPPYHIQPPGPLYYVSSTLVVLCWAAAVIFFVVWDLRGRKLPIERSRHNPELRRLAFLFSGFAIAGFLAAMVALSFK